MAKPKPDAQVELGGVTYSREELRTMFREAKRRGRESLRQNPVAIAVKYDARTQRVVLSLSNRTELSVPVEPSPAVVSVEVPRSVTVLS